MSDDQNIMLTSPAQSVLNRHNRRVKLSEQQLETISREDLVRNWRELDSYVEVLESQTANQEGVCLAACSIGHYCIYIYI